MKILILANNDVGLYKFRKELIQTLSYEHEVWLSLPDGDNIPALKSFGCHFVDTAIDRRGMNPLTDLRLILRYGEIVKGLKPDLVITYTIKPNVYGGLVCRRYKCKYSVNITGLGSAFQKRSKIRILVEKLYKISCKEAQNVFFENSMNRDLFIQRKLIRSEQSVLLNGAGVNLEDYPLIPYPKSSKVVFLFIGRIMKEKGIEELLSASRRLYSEGRDIELRIVGPMEEDYSAVLNEAQDGGWLKYYGFQPDVIPYIKDCSCFVLPSWHEGMANTNLECAACGRPVITSNIPGCKESVEEGVTGYLIERMNEESLYYSMKMFCSLTAEERSKMGIKGRNRMEKMFKKEIIVEETISNLIR